MQCMYSKPNLSYLYCRKQIWQLILTFSRTDHLCKGEYLCGRYFVVRVASRPWNLEKPWKALKMKGWHWKPWKCVSFCWKSSKMHRWPWKVAENLWWMNVVKSHHVQIWRIFSQRCFQTVILQLSLLLEKRNADIWFSTDFRFYNSTTTSLNLPLTSCLPSRCPRRFSLPHHVLPGIKPNQSTWYQPWAVAHLFFPHEGPPRFGI